MTTAPNPTPRQRFDIALAHFEACSGELLAAFQELPTDTQELLAPALIKAFSGGAGAMSVARGPSAREKDFISIRSITPSCCHSETIAARL